MVLALVPKQPHESHEKALKDCFFSIQDFRMQGYATYRQAFVELQAKRIQRVRDIYDQVVANTDLPPTIAMIVAQTLHPTVAEIQHVNSGNKKLVPVMHPELEAAIVAGNTKRFDELAVAGWLTDTPNKDSHDALALAVHHGQLEIVKKLVGQIPFVSEQRRNELKEVAENKNYTEIAQLIAAAWPNKTHDTALLKACEENRTGDFLQALARGANPDAIAHRIQDDPHEERAMGRGIVSRFWTDVIREKRLDHAQLLLKEGFDYLDRMNTEVSSDISIGLEDFAELYGTPECKALIEKALTARSAKIQ